MKRILLLATLGLALLLPFAATAQEETSSPFSADLSVKLKNRHVWNGGLSYNAWNLQPDITLSYYGFYVEAWGVFTVAQPYVCETDLYLGYDNDYINFWYGDFYYPNEAEKFNHFFDWNGARDGGNYHQQMAQLAFKGVEKFPIGLACGVFTFGDREKITKINSAGEVETSWGDERFSMYIEASYSHTLKTGQTLTYALLGTPYKGFFADGPNICSIKFSVAQPVKITESFALKLDGDLICNPYRGDLFFVLGVGF